MKGHPAGARWFAHPEPIGVTPLRRSRSNLKMAFFSAISTSSYHTGAASQGKSRR